MAIIRGQTIRVDNHKSGTREAVEWGKGIHLDKAMNDKKYNGARIKIYLDSDRKPEFIDKGKGAACEAMVKEVSNILKKDPQKNKQFVEDIIHEIYRFSQNLSPMERQQSLIKGAIRIGRHFELEKFGNVIENTANLCITSHYDKNSKVCYIFQDLNEQTIKVGEDENILRDNNTFGKIE